MLKSRRKVMQHGGSAVISIPGILERAEVGSDATMAADRVMLVDPRGIINESDLLEFLEAEIEPKLWVWIAKKARASR
ncbi:MAG TPA: hypothetical protein VEO20_02765 [Thermoplasmata archaeon]|nr:hypothetical protein [Thermoplasmata archaeon]